MNSISLSASPPRFGMAANRSGRAEKQRVVNHLRRQNGWPTQTIPQRFWHQRFKIALFAVAVSLGPMVALAVMIPMGALDDLFAVRKKRLAYHELGHLLAGHANGLPLRAQAVKISIRSGFTDYTPPGTKDEMRFFSQEIAKSKQPLTYLKQVLELYAAGRMMEILALGHGSMLALHDRWSALVIAGAAMLQNPAKISTILKLWLGKNRRARKLLLSYQKPAVDALARKLEHEKSWDRSRLQEILPSLKPAKVLNQ